MRMLRDNVLVKKLEKEQLGTIVLPGTVQDDWFRGKVMGVGPGSFGMDGQPIPVDVKVDDVIVFPPGPGGEYPTVLVNGEHLIIIPERLIWAVEE